MSDFFFRQLAKAAACRVVTPGMDLSVKIDLALAHDGSGPQVLEHLAARAKTVSRHSRLVLTLDHSFPAPTVKDREFQRKIADFAKSDESLRLYKNGEGVLHQVVAEEESLWPGMIIIGADGHVATAGAFSALAWTVAPAVLVDAVCHGTLMITVPEQIVIGLDGRLDPPAMARDAAMHVMARFGKQIAGKAVALTGSLIDGLSISEKMSLCNFLPEAGVSTAFVLPQGEPALVDLQVRGEEIEPLVAVPENSPRYLSPDRLTDQRVTVAIAGGCSAGRLDDMQVIGAILAEHRVHPDVTLIVTPASRNILESMDRLKITSKIRQAGGLVMPPGCGPCPGNHLGLLCAEDVAVSTTIRNSAGRIGSGKARIYLASPATVAWSAVHGRIASPPWSLLGADGALTVD